MSERVLKMQKTFTPAPTTPAIGRPRQVQAVAEHRLLLQEAGDVALSLERAIANNSFVVYTTSEVDAFRQGLEQHAAAVVDAGGIIDQKIQQSEEKLKEQVLNAINAIPQRLLSEEAVRILKEAVLVEFNIEVARLRQEFQAQIDAMASDA